MTFTSVAYNQLRLNKLDSEMFPLQKFRLEPWHDISTLPGFPPKTTLLRNNQLIGFRPLKQPAFDEATQGSDVFHPAVTSGEDVIPEKIAHRFVSTQERVKAVAEGSKREGRPGDDVVVVPLGTSSALPSKFRNVSSTFVQIPGYGNVLLDTGEGTWGQLARLYGDDERRQSGVWEVLRHLKCIFLSHMHGDHHIGLAKILAMRKLLDPAPIHPLYVVGVRHLLVYLREQSELEDLGLYDHRNGVVTVLSEALNWRPLREYDLLQLQKEPYLDIEKSLAAAAQMREALGLESFTAVDVVHRIKAYGVVLRHKDGWSLAFSGDTMPTNNLVRAGQDVTLLIHEATMGDDQAELAKEKSHSTMGQAIDIGKRMKAENILLTHFSARYPKMPPHLQPGSPRRGHAPTVALAFDHAQLRIADLWKLNMYLPAMEHNFSDMARLLADDEEPTSTVSW